MQRREFLAAVSAITAASAVASSKVVDAQSAEYGDSVLTTRASGLIIRENGPEDFSLKVISMDAAKDVTLERRVGRTARADIQLLYNLLQSLFLMRGLDV